MGFQETELNPQWVISQAYVGEGILGKGTSNVHKRASKQGSDPYKQEWKTVCHAKDCGFYPKSNRASVNNFNKGVASGWYFRRLILAVLRKMDWNES